MSATVLTASRAKGGSPIFRLHFAPMPQPPFDEECFFISPMGDENSDIRQRADGVRDFIVGPAAAEVGLVPVRADDIAKPGQITLQVIEHVLTAKAAVADLTGANPNVFYELAVRHTARLPIVLIAHANDRDKLPFDIAQMRTIFYDHQDLKSAADCRAQIATQLHQALENAAVDSPVAASVNLAHLQGGNPSEQVLAQLVSTIEGMVADTGRIERMVAQLTARTTVDDDSDNRINERPRVSATRVLALINCMPGITIPELAEKMGIRQNYLYRVLPTLADEGLVWKDGRGWRPITLDQ